MSLANVTITRCCEYDSNKIRENLEKHIELLGGLENFIKSGDSILLKPNFIAPRSSRHAAQTHPAMIIELAKLLLDFGAKPFVADSPAWSNAKTCAQKLRLTEPLAKLNVPIKELDKPVKRRIGDSFVNISSVATKADAIINIPKFKAHQQLVATFAIKNMFGTVAGKQKALWHFKKGDVEQDFCELLIDIYKYMNPIFTVIDGVYAMDGPGPINGRTRKLGYIISSTDPIACEAVCAKLIGRQAEDFPILRTAKKIGFGTTDIEKINIRGDGLPQNPVSDFEIPALIPIKFSLKRVMKSIAKQILLLFNAKSQKNKQHPHKS